MNQTLYVLYACDENYAPYAGVSMNSLFQNNQEIPHICVYLVEDHVSEENKEKFLRQAEAFGRELILVDAGQIVERTKELNIPSYRGSQAANSRLFFDTFLPPDAERLLYLDCDTLVCGSLAELLTCDLGGAAAGVVRDSLTNQYKELIGFSLEEDYFNSGVLLIDTRAWQEQGIKQRLIHHTQTTRACYCNPDQDLLNIILKDTKCLLPPTYNFQPSHRAFSDKAYFSVYRHKKYYTSEELAAARENPKILHTYRFLGDFPWHANNLHPDTALFDHYMERSLWSDYEKKAANRGLLFTVEKLMYRLLPKRIFLKIFAAISLRAFRKQNRAIEQAMKKESRT